MDIVLSGRIGDLNLLKMALLLQEYTKDNAPSSIQFLQCEKDASLVLGRLKFTSYKVAYLYFIEKAHSSLKTSEPSFFKWENEEFIPILRSFYADLSKKPSFQLIMPLLKSKLSSREDPLTDLLLWANLYFFLSHPIHSEEAFRVLPELKSFHESLYSKKTQKTLQLIKFEGVEFPEVQGKRRLTIGEEELLLKKNDKSTQKDGTILPVKGEKNMLITSALPYVNNVPHLGNIVGSVLSADVYARYCRLRGYNTLFICGTDEHGTTTEKKALEEDVSPREICDKYHALHSGIYEWFHLSFDRFGRTTSEKNKKLTQDIFWKLYNKGYILEDSMDQLWCESCSRFLADRFVEGICPFCKKEGARGDQCDACGKLINSIELIDPQCSSCKSPPRVKNTKHLFLDLPKLEDKLSDWLEKSSVNWTNNARVIAKSWVKLGLKPRCITRDLKWGVPVPLEGYQDKVFYMWIDAPIGYIGITANYSDSWEKWWKDAENVELIQFMGKDNVPFHSIIFPSILLGSDDSWVKVNKIMSTEYLNYEETKFSKSRGIGVFGNDVIDTGIPADIWRFYLIYTRPENQDSAFKWNDLLLKNNTELLNNLGNFVNRALKFSKENFGGVVSSISEKDLTNDPELVSYIKDVSKQIQVYVDFMEKSRQRDGVSSFLTVSRLGNQLMQSYTPWKRVKGTEEDKAKAHLIINLCVNTAALLSVLIFPVMPQLSAKIQKQLNVSLEQINSLNSTTDFVRLIKDGHVIGTPEPLISEIKENDIKLFEKKFGGSQSERESQNKTAPSSSNSLSSTNVGDIEKELAQTANKVRDLKANKAEKSIIDSEVKILLGLKKKLAELTGVPIVEDKKKSKKSKK
nr:methionine--tRNA ligase, cytoplasmic-like [Lepeophtheirus salmonis]